MTTEGRDIVSVIKEQIESFGTNVTMVDVGAVVEVGDGVARIHGLRGAKYNELLEFYLDFIKLHFLHILFLEGSPQISQ